jgi:hypothetical protein
VWQDRPVVGAAEPVTRGSTVRPERRKEET